MERILKAALFDLEGTLIDTEGQYTRFWDGIAKQYCPDIPDFANTIKGTTLVQIFKNYFPDKQIQDEIARKLDEFEASMDFTPYPGVLDFILDLKKEGIKTAIATSSNRPKFSHLKTKCPEFVALFDRILTAEDFSASKPDPDCYLKAAAALVCTIDECAVFEDAFTGLQAGMASGMLTVGLTTTNSREAIEGKCHFILDSWVGFTTDSLRKLLRSAL